MKKRLLIAASGLLMAAQAAPPTPRIAPPSSAALFSGRGGAVAFDRCGLLTLATLSSDAACAARVARGETAPSLAIAILSRQAATGNAEQQAVLALLERTIAAEDHPAAHYMLGSMVGTGETLAPDYPRALKHLEKAVAGGNVAAADLLASMMLEGRGTARDVTRAVRLLETAAAGGMEGSAVRLAGLHLQGRLVPRNEALGRAILEAAAAVGDPQATKLQAMAGTKVANYQVHPSQNGKPELRVYGLFDNPQIPPAFGFTDEFRRVHESAYSDPEITARLEREQATLPTPFLYELARRLAATDPAKARGFWMLARMRTVYDARRCQDRQALQAITAWESLVMPDLRRLLTFITRPEVEAAAAFALDRDAAMPADTRPWWLCYSGAATYSKLLAGGEAALPLTPAAEWPKVRDEVRAAMKALPTRVASD